MRTRLLSAVLLLCAAVFPPLAVASAPTGAALLRKLPLEFEANQGQTDPRVAYLSRVEGYTVFLLNDAAVFSLRSGQRVAGNLTMQLTGVNPESKAAGVGPLAGTSNYFVGQDLRNGAAIFRFFPKLKLPTCIPGSIFCTTAMGNNWSTTSSCRRELIPIGYGSDSRAREPTSSRTAD